ncbi:MAG: hypothetical protein J6112_10350 [Clostridia bacterium]|nr:hypothetical protein [Clostridia bacterium]
MTKIRIGESVNGIIKPLHGVGQPPMRGIDTSRFHYLTEAGIPFSRLHDVGGYFAENLFVDVPNIFRDFEKDPDDPASYDFAFTDILIRGLVDAGVEPFFRLGVTIENYCTIRAYRIFPPADSLKWARICEGIIRHYTEGWANGFSYRIRYWEIWNEPDNEIDPMENPMWRGTKEQFYNLYDVAAKHLKKCFPHLKIGGYGSCGFYALFNGSVPPAANVGARFDYFMEFFDGFLDRIKASGAPLDFFSWHSYGTIENNKICARYARKRLDDAGFNEAGIFCNEWNLDIGFKGTVRHAADVAGMMLAFADEPLDGAMFYDAQLSVSDYGGLFNPLTKKPFPAYYAFVMFNELYKLGGGLTVSVEGRQGLYAKAATDGNNTALMIANAAGHLIKNVELILPDGKRPVRIREIFSNGLEAGIREIEFNGNIGKDKVLLIDF